MFSLPVSSSFNEYLNNWNNNFLNCSTISLKHTWVYYNMEIVFKHGYENSRSIKFNKIFQIQLKFKF